MLSRYVVVFLAIIALSPQSSAHMAPGWGVKKEHAYRDLERGNRYRDRQDYRRAIKAYSRAIDSRALDGKDLGHAYFLRAQSRRALAYMTGAEDAALIEALKDNHEAIKLYDDEPGYFQSRARTYSFLGAYPEAFDDLETALRITKKPFWITISKGALQRVVGDYEAALETLRSIPEVRNNKRSMPPRYQLALVFLDQGNYREAITVLDEGLKAQSDHSSAWLERGCANAKLGNYAEALANYRKGVELREDLDHFDPPYPSREHNARVHREELDLLQSIAEKKIDPDKDQIESLCTRFWWRLHFHTKRERSPLLTE